MRITLLQTQIVWKDSNANLAHLYDSLSVLKGKTDLVVLPEMFNTGFVVNSNEVAEPANGRILQLLQTWAAAFKLALAGSMIVKEGARMFNRAFFFTPEKKHYFYDKRHLFRMGGEHDHFCHGDKRVVVPYMGWNICLLVCYDLRFPVWSRNVDNQYDILIYVANWPQPRRRVWNTLLAARAIENCCYVCGVNRVGTDGEHLDYDGGTSIFSPKGELLCISPDNQPHALNYQLNKYDLETFRQKFPVWLDADKFSIF